MEERVLAVVATLGAALVATSFAAARPHTTDASPTVVKVSMYDMGFKLSKATVQRGTVVFRAVNDGIVVHDLRIRKVGPRTGIGTRMLAPGERATLRVRLVKAGRYPFLCTVPGHAAAGMKGTLVVK